MTLSTKPSGGLGQGEGSTPNCLPTWHHVLHSDGIDLKELGGGSDVEMFKNLHRD